MIFNVVGLIRALCSNISKEEFPSEFMAQFQYEVLGYIDYTDESLNDGYRTVCVMNLDMKYSYNTIFLSFVSMIYSKPGRFELNEQTGYAYY